MAVRAARPAQELVALFTLPADFDSAGVEAGTQPAELVHAAGAGDSGAARSGTARRQGPGRPRHAGAQFGGRGHQDEPARRLMLTPRDDAVRSPRRLIVQDLTGGTEAGCVRVFVDKAFGHTADRTELTVCLDYLRPGDVLVVPSLDRLALPLPAGP